MSNKNPNYPAEAFWNCDSALNDHDHVFLSWYADELHRRDRLNRVLGYFAVLAGVIPRAYIRSTTGLIAIEDHKGNLTSVWKDLNSFCQHQDHLQQAWGMEGELDHTAVILRRNSYAELEVC